MMKIVISAMLLAAATASVARAQDKITFGTDWKAEAEHGGFYQALATGLYKSRGIEVTIRQGGPQVNHAQLLAAGRLDFNMAPSSFVPLNFVRENIPAVAVAAMFQKDPQALIAHAEAGYKSLADMNGKPIMIGSDTRVGSWLFLKSKFGFTDDQIRPYTFNVAPFLTNKEAIQQGYVTSEPYTIEKAGAKPAVFLLADAGYASYAAVIQTLNKTVETNPGLVQRFVDASIEGWYSYLYGDPSPANALIKKDNAEMTDDLLAYGMVKMKEYGIVDSGDALSYGIGAMTEARWREFFEMMSKAGLYPADMDWKKAFTLAFANKKIGMALKK
jgi:NitT/TauT family transport system substrate-binding protein